MVAAAHPLATEAGLDILRAGGSAVDAAVAVEAVLSLVEPQSSGFGGGAFMIHYDAETGAVSAYDGRETAPAATTPNMFLDADGAPMDFLSAKNSGLSIGVPGVVDMLALAHEDHGFLDWAALFESAIQYAEDGFAVTPRLHALIAGYASYGMVDAPDTRAYFYRDDGSALPVGHVLDNPEYAGTLRAIANDPRALYEGALAAAIAQRAQAGPRGGTLSREDLAGFHARRVDPVCRGYRDMTVCGAPPPASGGVAINQILGILENRTFSSAGAGDPANWRLFIEASRLAYADRDRYVADQPAVSVPIAGLLDADYLAARARLIDPDAAMDAVAAGNPAGAGRPGADASADTPGTSHFVVVDASGDVVSMTATVESAFGSLRMAGGMLLNNQLTDFSFHPLDADGRRVANAVAPGKRPRSSMSPTIVLDADGEFLLAAGSPGGNSIIAYTAKAIIGVLDWGLSPQDAIELPNVIARGDVVRIETDRIAPPLVDALHAAGHETTPMGPAEISGIHTVFRHSDGTLEGGADTRREGVVGTP